MRRQMTEEHKEKLQAARRKVKPVSYKKLVRGKCLDCLNVKGNGLTFGWDCELPRCSLYEVMPWRGRPMPQVLWTDDEKRQKQAATA